MRIETFRWLAGVIAAHPDRQIVGRTRLQKTIRLLQRVGLPTDFTYKLFFYGPYSEGVQATVDVLESLQLAKEEARMGYDGTQYYVITAVPEANLPQISQFQAQIDVLANQSDAVILELAATYDAFRELGSDHRQAMEQLRRKKGSKCDGGREALALELLTKLGLSAA